MLDIARATIKEINKAYGGKELTVKELVLAYLSRIAKFDKCPGGLNSVMEINPDILFIADALDEKMRSMDEIPPMFGIPVLLKDNINTADRLRTSSGSVALADNYAPYDAHVAERLRKVGAAILGKVNMTEFANYMTREGMPSGYSSRGGQVLNPYNREKTPSGSSSGSGVAVAAGLCAASVGSETAGSVISPARHNGIVGIKPTMGLVGRSGIIPISGSLDTAGPMARTVWDAAALLVAIAGLDPNDAATQAKKRGGNIDYTKQLDTGLEGLRIGINRAQRPGSLEASEDEKAAFDRLCALLSNAGALMIDNVNIGSNPRIENIMRYEFKACMNYYLSTLKGNAKVRTLKDIIEYNQANASVALKYGQSLLIDCENNTSGAMIEPDYIDAIMEREKDIAELDRLFNDNSLDVMLCEFYSNAAPFTGFPSMTIPIGQGADNMPYGSYWIARRFDEAALLKVTYAAERLLGLSLAPVLA